MPILGQSADHMTIHHQPTANPPIHYQYANQLPIRPAVANPQIRCQSYANPWPICSQFFTNPSAVRCQSIANPVPKPMQPNRINLVPTMRQSIANLLCIKCQYDANLVPIRRQSCDNGPPIPISWMSIHCQSNASPSPIFHSHTELGPNPSTVHQFNANLRPI